MNPHLYVAGITTTVIISSAYIAWSTYHMHAVYLSTHAPVHITTPLYTPMPVQPRKLPILMYHYVEYLKDPTDTTKKSLDIPPDMFERQLTSFIHAGYTFYQVRDLPDILNARIPYAEKNITLTFDDGYAGFYTGAFPILKKYHIPATLYLVNEFINRKGYLTDAQVHDIVQSGIIEIGAHTTDHLYLKRAPYIFAKEQILTSKRRLENRYDIEVETFAYPYGAFTGETVDIVKESGYTAAVSTIPGTIQSLSNLYTMNRIRAGLISGSDSARIIERMHQ